LNKIDLLEDKEYIRYLQREYPEAILISAERGININALLEKMQKVIENESKFVKVFLPYEKFDMVPLLYQFSSVVKKEEKTEGVEFYTKLLKNREDFFHNLFKPFITN